MAILITAVVNVSFALDDSPSALGQLVVIFRSASHFCPLLTFVFRPRHVTIQAAEDTPARRSVLSEQGDGPCRALSAPRPAAVELMAGLRLGPHPWQLEVLEGGHARLNSNFRGHC